MHNLKSHITGESAEGLCRPQFEESWDVLNEVRSVLEPGEGFAPSLLCLVMNQRWLVSIKYTLLYKRGIEHHVLTSQLQKWNFINPIEMSIFLPSYL